MAAGQPVRNGPSTNSLSGDGLRGTAPMGLWKEPEDQPNWCGPGSAVAVISSWKSVGDGVAYMRTLAPRMMTGVTTYASTWVTVVNQEIGGTFYQVSYPSGISQFKDWLKYDIGYINHPVNLNFNTNGMEGWGAWTTSHYAAANGFDYTNPNVSGQTITYGDSAPDSANGYGTPNPFGWHTWSLQTTYDQIYGQYNLIIR